MYTGSTGIDGCNRNGMTMTVVIKHWQGTLAKDYLESCAPNAIVISFGDNDTYPLWYAQEVEGVRRDIRVINSSLLGIDWYINQLRYKVNQSDPIDPIWSAEQIEGAKRDGIYFVAKSCC